MQESNQTSSPVAKKPNMEILKRWIVSENLLVYLFIFPAFFKKKIEMGDYMAIKRGNLKAKEKRFIDFDKFESTSDFSVYLFSFQFFMISYYIFFNSIYSLDLLALNLLELIFYGLSLRRKLSFCAWFIGESCLFWIFYVSVMIFQTIREIFC